MINKNDRTVINPDTAEAHTPDDCPLGARVSEYHENINVTLKTISDSLVEHRTIMQHLRAGLDATTAMTLEMEKKFHGHTKMFQGAMIIMSVLLSLFCWILLERNNDIKDLAKIANVTMNEAQVERARREQDQKAMEKELVGLHQRDSEILTLMRQTLENATRNKQR